MVPLWDLNTVLVPPVSLFESIATCSLALCSQEMAFPVAVTSTRLVREACMAADPTYTHFFKGKVASRP